LQCVDLIGCSSVGRRQTRRRNLASACRRACTIAIVLIAGVVSRDAAAQASAAEPATSAAPDWITDLPLPVEPKGLPAEPAGLCDDKPGGPAWLDRMQAGLYRGMCLTAARFDGFFGSARFKDEYQSTHGSLSVGTLWDQRDGFDPALRFRLRMKLPQLSDRFNVFIGRVDPVEHVTELRDDFDTLPRQFGQEEDDAVLVGLGYSPPTHGIGNIDFDVGTELSLPLDPYVKARYRIAVPFLEHNVLRLRETLFWQKSEQAGFTSRIDLERVLAQNFLVRWSTSGTFTQNTHGVEWLSSATLFQNLGGGRALAYQVGASGESDLDVPLQDYGFRLIFRRRIFRDWLMLELRSSITWPRETLLETRESNLGVGVAVEMLFGERTRK
jgi:hypothetical protein